MIFPEDIQYERWLETGKVATIGDYSLEDWPLEDCEIADEDCGYELSDPKHPTFHDRYSEIADLEDF